MRHVTAAFVKIVIVAMLIVVAYIYVQQQQTPEAVKALQEQQRIERMEQWHAITTMLIYGGGMAALLAVYGLVALLFAKVRNSRELIYAEDGLFPVKVQEAGTLLDRWRGRSQHVTLNPNMLAIPAGTITVQRNGDTTLSVGADGFSHPQLLTAHSGQQRIQRAQAKERSRQMGKWEVLADRELLERALPQRKPDALPPVDEPDVIDVTPRLLTTDALNQSKRDRFILGQSDSGALCTVNMRDAVHLGIVGATGCGKTVSTGYQLALEALKTNYQVVILDPKGGMDWGDFAAVTEWHDTDTANFADQMRHIYIEYQRRMEIAKRHDVRHISRLNDADLPPLLCIVEEYGELTRRLKRADRDKVDGMIDSMAQKGRAADIHMALIDQYPEFWSQQVRMATKPGGG